MGFPWMIHGMPWNSMESHGGSMGFQGKSLELHGEINIPRKVIMPGRCPFHKNQRRSMTAFLIKNIHVYSAIIQQFTYISITTNCSFIKIPWNTYEIPMNRFFLEPWIYHFPISWPHCTPLIFMKMISWLIKKTFFFYGHKKLAMIQNWN